MREVFDEPSRIIRSVLSKVSGGTSTTLAKLKDGTRYPYDRVWLPEPGPNCPLELSWAYPDGWADTSDNRTTAVRTNIRAVPKGFEWYDNIGDNGMISPKFYTGYDRDIASAARHAILRHQTETSLTAFRSARDEICLLRERLAELETNVGPLRDTYTKRHDRLDARIHRTLAAEAETREVTKAGR